MTTAPMTGPASAGAAEVALEVRHLSKSYPGVRAVDDVSLRVLAGEVHGLVGENGAGKSTLVKAIAGALAVDSGTVSIWGTELPSADPHSAAHAGLAVIYQELTIVPDLSAVSNVFLGRMPRRFGMTDSRRASVAFAALAERVGFAGSPSARAGDLSVSGQQLLEIMRALSSGRRLVIMDEPTASLGPEDIRSLHRVIDRLRRDGCSVVYISHDLDAVLEICDAVTVLREGHVVESRRRGDWSKDALVASMLGGVQLDAVAAPTSRRRGRPLLTARGIRAAGVRLDELTVHAGEIIGLAGLVGSGRTRLLRTLAGARPAEAGEIEDDRGVSRWPGSIRAAHGRGIALAPEDRKGQGLVLHRASAWNIALGRFRRAGGLLFSRSRLSRWAAPTASSLGFDPDRLDAPAGTLSGGNQQKLMLARWMSRPVSCLLLDEPTRGVDIGAKAQIFETTRRIVDEGRAVIWASSDLTEIVEHSDRILVVVGGRIAAELPKGSSVRDVLDICFGVKASTREENAA